MSHSHAIEQTIVSEERLDVRVNILICFSIIIAGVSTPPQALRAFAAYYSLVIIYVIAARVPLLPFVKRSLAAIPFVLMVAIFVPFFRREPRDVMYALPFGLAVSRSGLWLLANAALKGTLGVCALVALGAGTPFADLLSGLHWLRVPRALVNITAFMIRYLDVLRDEIERMRRAADSRGRRSRWLWHARVIGQMIGALFLRSIERAERVFAAMQSRGYGGRIHNTPLPAFRAIHAIQILCAASFVVAIRLLLG